MNIVKKFIVLALCVTLCLGCVPVTASAARDFSFETELADDLYALNVFKGTGTGYDLESPLKRQDAVIMLLRLLGQIDDAKAYSKTHPFTDVPAYADLYISYAKDNALAYGTGDTTFGVTDTTTQQFLTFTLRALGYSDKGGKDFTYANPYDLAETVGILPEGVDLDNFLRADVVLICYAALAANMADGSGTLAEKLIADGLFTQAAFDANYDPDAFTSAPEKTVLDSEEIYAKCSSSVFRIDVYDADGIAFASGSGFFIDGDGTAVTNYHVLDGAHSATAALTNGEVYDILGVYDYDQANDWAVIQIDCGSCDCLTIGDTSTIVGGAKIYALGSPLGLDDTFSDGMISNANRVVDGVTYIQISAPISHGSSGGALINKYGEVIGICSAGFVDGQNLNLALPITCIEGYSRSGITTLAELFPAGTGSSDTSGCGSQQQAYDTLLATISNTQTNVDADGCAYYYEALDDENFVWFTDYDSLIGEIEVCVCYSPLEYDIEYWAYLYLSPDGVGEDWSDMESDLVEVGEEMAYYLLMDALFYTDAFFSIANEDLGYPLCSVADFGFTY